MKRSAWRFALALMVLSLVTTIGISAKERISRPLKMAGYSQQVLNMTDGTITGHVDAVATHMGRVSISAWGTLADPIIHGVITAANGDLVYWEWGMGTTDVTITGGTGIFDGAGGMFVLDVQFLSQEFDPDSNTLTTNYVYAASGKISY